MSMIASGRSRLRAGLRYALPLLAATAIFAGACSDDSGDDDAGSDEPIAREVLAMVPSSDIEGYDVHLQRITIAPGAALIPHYHPGVQVAKVEEGELTYTVMSGSAFVARDVAEEPTEELAAPTETVLEAGDTVYEPDEVEHFGANKGDEPVLLTVTAIIESGEPIAIEVDAPGETETAAE